jgi:SPP1 gp7 family putative phage head morphogenesis protein
VPEVEAFTAQVELHVEAARDLQHAADTLYELLTTTAGAGLAGVMAEEMLLADLLGRLEVDHLEMRRALKDTEQFTGVSPKEAIAFFRKKKVMSRAEFDALDDGYKAKGFTVTALKNHYQLEQVHALLLEGLQRGTPRTEIVREMRARYRAWGIEPQHYQHIETVVDTNLNGAYAAGRYKQMKRVQKVRPYWQYRTVGDSRVRPTHREQDKKVFPADHPFWQTWYPPCGFRCRCSVVSLSQKELEDEGLTPEEQLPEAKPDPGFEGSPATQEYADEVVDRARARVKKLDMLRAPSMERVLLPPTPEELDAGARRVPIYNSAGDLLRSRDPERNAKVDKFAKLTGPKVEKLAGEHPVYNVFPRGQLGRVPTGETWVEVPVYSQNLDTVEQIATRLAANPETSALAARLTVVGRATYGDWDPEGWRDPEVAHDAAAAARLGRDAGWVLSRSTETILRVVARGAGELALLLGVVMQTELGHGNSVRRAWETGDIRIRGTAAASEQFPAAWLNRRKMGSGEQVVLSRGRPIPGWESEAVLVNARLWDFLPEF